MWTFQPRAPLYHNIIMFISIESTSLCIFLRCPGITGNTNTSQPQLSSVIARVQSESNSEWFGAFCFWGRRANQRFLLRKTGDKLIPCYLSVNHLTYKVYSSHAPVTVLKGIPQFDKATAPKPLIFSVTAFLRCELSPRKCRNPSGHVQRKLIIFYYLFSYLRSPK